MCQNDNKMDLKLPRAILLDLDDTIIANEVFKEECWERIGIEFSNHLNGVSTDQFLYSIMKQSDLFWADAERHRIWRQKLEKARRVIVGLAFAELGIHDNSLAEGIADRFSTLRDEALRPFPGAIETVQNFKERGIKLALVTNGNSETQRKKIQRFDLSRLFDHILIEGEQGIGKPDERIYIKALQLLGTEPEETWMIGDNIEWDVLAPQRVGIKGIWIHNKRDGYKGLPSEKPLLILKSLPEIMNYTT